MEIMPARVARDMVRMRLEEMGQEVSMQALLSSTDNSSMFWTTCQGEK